MRCVPHPRIRGRAFVLIPLLDLVEDLHHPALERSIRSLASEVDETTVRRLARLLLAASAPCGQASEPIAMQSHGLKVQSCTGSETTGSSNRVLLESIQQGVTADTEQVCRLRAISTGAGQGLVDEVNLELVHDNALLREAQALL